MYEGRHSKIKIRIRWKWKKKREEIIEVAKGRKVQRGEEKYTREKLENRMGV